MTAGDPAPGRRGGRRRLPPVLTAGAVAVSVVVLLPLVFLIVQAVQVGWADLHQLLFRSLTATLIWNTVSLVVVVTALSAVVGTLAAWFVERTDVPCRRLLAILVVIPLGIPDFLVSFGWKAIFPSIAGFWAAVLVMTLAVYPLVFLPVAASLRWADPAQEEVARSLGLGRVRTFWTVTVGQARLAIFGGAILVGLVVLAEFGAFEILGYQTLTTEIYNEFQVGFNEPAACALSVILVLLGGVLLAGEGSVRGQGRTSRLGAGAARQLRPLPLGRGRPVAFAGVALLVVLALGVPVGAVIYLLIKGGSSTLPAASSLADATLNTFGYGAAAGVVATLAAVPIALLSVRFPRRKVLGLERSNLVVLAVPGLVIALSLAYVTEHFLQGRFYQTSSLQVVAYVIMFFPLAVVAVRAAVARAPGRAGGGGRLARRQPTRRHVARHAAAGGPGPGGRLRPGVPRDGDRAHGDLGPAPDERADARHAVLGLRVERVLLPGGHLRRRHDPHCRRARLRTRSLVRPPAGADGRRRPERARPHRPQWCPHEGPSHLGRGQGVRAPTRPARRGSVGSGRFVHRHPRLVGEREDDVAADCGGVRTAR